MQNYCFIPHLFSVSLKIENIGCRIIVFRFINYVGKSKETRSLIYLIKRSPKN